ncbi:MAG: tetratricopeptide repeat protein [Acidobacteriota bacterium]
MRILPILLLLALAPTAGIAQTASSDPSAAGEKALDEGRFEAAVEIFSKLVTADPADVGSHFSLAIAYSQLGRDALAIPEYRKVLELQPDIYEVHINLGQVLLRSKQPAEAILHLKRAHEQKPQEFRPAFFLGEALAEVDQQNEAVAALTAAVAIDPKSSPAELSLGRALAATGKLPEAETHYRKAVALDPQAKGSLLELGQMLEQKGDTAGAMALYREFPESPAAREHLGFLLIKEGKPEDAIAALEPVVASAPTKTSRLALAQAYVQHKDLAKAEPLLEQVVADEPKNFELRMTYGRVLRDEHKATPSAFQFQEATRINNDSPEAWSELSGALILIEEYPAALQALERVKQLGAEKPGHVFFRATSLDHLKQIRAALDQYNEFLNLSKGQNPDQEFQARMRARTLAQELEKR